MEALEIGVNDGHVRGYQECGSAGSGAIKIVFAYLIARFPGKVNIFENLFNAVNG
jgi:hypothetical protein